MSCAVRVPSVTPHTVPVVLVLLTVLVTVACGPPVPTDALDRAAFDGDTTRVASLLGERGAADAGFDALVWASRAGRLEVIALLVDRGVDLNRRDDRNHWTPLMHALHTHQQGAARLLLDRGADPRIGTSGNSPVEMAALDDEAELVRRMLAAGVPRDQRERAFEIAVRGGALVDVDRPLFGSCRTASVRVLVESDPSLRGSLAGGFLSALWWAKRQGCAETVTLATAGPDQARR